MYQRLFTVLFTLGLCCLTACNRSSVQAGKDPNPIEIIFPDLKGFSETSWRAERLGTNSLFSVPGPSSFKYEGVIILSEIQVKRLLSEFSWKTTAPSFDVDSYGYSSSPGNWLASDKFSEWLLREKLVGELYFDPKKGMIYFDVKTK